MTPPDITNKTLLNQVMLNTNFGGSMNAISLQSITPKLLIQPQQEALT